MLLVLQFPFTDARPFSHEDTSRLLAPIWSLPDPSTDFVRSFGSVQKRKGGGIDDWFGEGMYCRATGAIKFARPFPARLDLNSTGLRLKQHCAFRRFMADGRFQGDGSTVARIELGLRYQVKDHAWGPPPLPRLSGAECLELIQAVLKQPVVVRDEGKSRTCELWEADRYIARQYLRASTRRCASRFLADKEWWFKPGNPLLLIEYARAADLAELPQHARHVEAEVLSKSGISLSHLSVEFRGRGLEVWLLGSDLARDDNDVRRRLRINLLRFHAELESIKYVLRLIARQKVTINRGTEATERLQMYLQDATKLLAKESREGLPQSAIFDVTQQGQDIVDRGDRENLLFHLSGIRRNLLHKIENFIEPKEGAREPTYIITGERVSVTFEQNRSKVVTNQNLNIINSTVGDVNQVAAESIQGSFNKVAQSEAPQELKARLEELNKAVAEMCKNLPEDKQKQAAQDLEVLTDEALSETPRKKWYELSSEGLLEAANTVGQMAAPVVAAVKAILPLLAGQI